MTTVTAAVRVPANHAVYYKQNTKDDRGANEQTEYQRDGNVSTIEAILSNRDTQDRIIHEAGEAEASGPRPR